MIGFPIAPPGRSDEELPLSVPFLDNLRSAVIPATEPAAPVPAAATPGPVGQATSRPARPLSKVDTPISIGSSFSSNKESRSKGVMAPVEQGIDHDLRGTLGAMVPDVFGLNKDKVTSNYHLALFLSTLPNVSPWVSGPGNTRTFATTFVDCPRAQAL
ncbi:unnamed protein product, partial [Ectocarpus fasciculatus]